MQDFHANKDFFDWLRRISGDYGEAMATWGQEVHDSVADSKGLTAPQHLVLATDNAVERLVSTLIAIGERHDDARIPKGGAAVLDALDRLLGASAEMLRDARAGMDSQGLAAISALAPRIAELRGLEAEVERQTDQVRERLDSAFGDPNTR